MKCIVTSLLTSN